MKILRKFEETFIHNLREKTLRENPRLGNYTYLCNSSDS